MTDDTEKPTGPRVVSMNDAKSKSEVERVGDQLRKDMDAICANATTIAKLRRTAYLAYIREGFTAEEALVLCCK